jgi:hypothetical protein
MDKLIRVGDLISITKIIPPVQSYGNILEPWILMKTHMIV